MLMQITAHDVGDVTVLNLKGRMVLEEGDTPLNDQVSALVEQGRVKLVLDMHDVTYVDSAGLGTMIANYVRVHRRGGDIKLLHLTPRSAHVMGITRLNHVFQIFEEEDDAVRSFDQQP
jgi:anti-anti-sigma factor